MRITDSARDQRHNFNELRGCRLGGRMSLRGALRDDRDQRHTEESLKCGFNLVISLVYQQKMLI